VNEIECEYVLMVIIFVVFTYVDGDYICWVHICWRWLYMLCAYMLLVKSFTSELVVNCWCTHVLEYNWCGLVKLHEVCIVVVES